MAYLCECNDLQCGTLIELEFEEMVFLRRTPGYVMVPGHQSPGDEVVGWDSDGRFIYVGENSSPR